MQFGCVDPECHRYFSGLFSTNHTPRATFLCCLSATNRAPPYATVLRSVENDSLAKLYITFISPMANCKVERKSKEVEGVIVEDRDRD